jgi:chitin deacetylase
MQLIHNSTGGRVPRYWRPPYGDSDMRTRSIAKEVFGLETVIWNSEQVPFFPDSGKITYQKK